jgi:hypothetical protein
VGLNSEAYFDYTLDMIAESGSVVSITVPARSNKYSEVLLQGFITGSYIGAILKIVNLNGAPWYGRVNLYACISFCTGSAACTICNTGPAVLNARAKTPAPTSPALGITILSSPLITTGSRIIFRLSSYPSMFTIIAREQAFTCNAVVTR